MTWYFVLIPAAATAVVIRIDSVLIGPYWTFMEVVPGMGGTDVDWWYSRPTLRWAVTRRYAYLVLLGAFLSIIDADLATTDAAVIGVVTAGLLLWPLLFHGLPLGVAKSDWQLIPLYLGVIVSFAAAPVVGVLAVEYVEEQSDGDVPGWLKDQVFEVLFWPLVLFIGTAFFLGSYKSLRNRKREREEEGYE
jgi:hypothetical protein